MTTVREYMNRELVYIRQDDRAETVLGPILDFGITAVPVLDDEHRPVGVLSLRDLVDNRRESCRITRPACTIGVDVSIEDAARLLAEGRLHHVVVVDHDGRAAGMLSAIDVLRALEDLPPQHPTFEPRPKIS